jgi:hypothetical protein
MALRHFPFKHPTFGTKNFPKTSNHWRVSVYYWWYEYLRRNIDYKKTCNLQGKGGKCTKLYEQFGNVHEGDFKSWWTSDDRGAILFADPPTPNISVIKSVELHSDFLSGKNIVLNVPLNLPVTFLVKNFRKILVKHHTGKRGHTQARMSTARFVPRGKVDVGFLEIALLVWDEKTANPKKPLWQIAQDVGIAGKHKLKSTDSPMESRDKRNVLAAMTSRYYKKACLMIEATSKGIFLR